MSNSFLKPQTICYVCGKVIKGKAIYVGKGLYRHTECAPGSKRWLKSAVSKKSDMRDWFIKEE